MLRDILMFAVPGVVVIAVGAAFGYHVHWGGLVLLFVPLTLLAGILLRLSLEPAWLRVLGHLSPMYYCVQAARSLAAGTVASGTVGVGFLVTAAVAGLAVWWGTRAYQQAMA